MGYIWSKGSCSNGSSHDYNFNEGKKLLFCKKCGDHKIIDFGSSNNNSNNHNNKIVWIIIIVIGTILKVSIMNTPNKVHMNKK